MLSTGNYIRQSLELHLYFTRTMKEHSFFLEAGFTPKDKNYIDEADAFRLAFDNLLFDVISISDGVVSRDLLEAGEAITPYTLDAEKASAYYTGVKIATNLTKLEEELAGDSFSRHSHEELERKVAAINNRALELTAGLIRYKSRLLSDVLSCKVFTVNYPLLIDHIMREAKLYFTLVKRLQEREDIDLEREAYEQEYFWNRIMAEHAKFLRGLLDPTEDELINMSNNFGREFDKLTMEAREAMNQSVPLSKVTDDSYKATLAIGKFKEQGTVGLLECKIKSIIVPLLGDHILREANHYLRLLKIFKRVGELE
ncbi:DUF2935 domain-containing protein [Clostridium beijerinckii]|uniref:DUF2935 domain-containing protein n=1 Tax=Clostridium beijerinckii TaxID=1520 RepID=A0A1S9N4J2_CLOBE|nr:DUF2935 domain-containing protein [Clostridium beijerinckii]MZK52820.1 DUF2935 domain-containing protein [Clostridium beijerinckii]MZK60921.1 DUF2935 domain-containing protein [Clostridium beijerinckii]MZK71127.1 DUF2935 domain-containing protein [Clostridium beijerinckii]MZK76485.1 DUF2935 domain-containing protein [Clostridium beijerinckii]MZK86154.1 DUF2935 domain-containing protein [Clostridium beijerinckii]